MIDFEYLLLDLKRNNEEFILSTNKILDNVFAIDQKDKSKDIMHILEMLIHRFKGLSEQEQTDLMKWLDQILRLRLPETNRDEILEKIKRGEASMVHGWDIAFDNERKKGRKEGKKEGIKEGIKEGEKKKEIELTENLIKIDLPVEKIIQVTGLPEEEIMKIKIRLKI